MSPETFSDELSRRLGSTYRLRRSLDGKRWRVEQKVTRTYDYPASDDRTLMLKEGYSLVLDTPDSDHLPCPDCDNPISLPLFERAEFRCPLCTSHGKRKWMVDGYFPLVDRTLQYLERYHPRRGGAIAAEMKRENEILEAAKRKDLRNLSEDIANDSWLRVSGGVQFGRTKSGTPHVFGHD